MPSKNFLLGLETHDFKTAAAASRTGGLSTAPMPWLDRMRAHFNSSRCFSRMLLCAAYLVVAGSSGAHAQTAAVASPRAKGSSATGTVLDWQPIAGAPEGAAAYRILYRSTGLRGEPITVSGAIIIPAG